MKPAWVPPKERNVAMKISNGGLDSAALPPKTLSGGLAKNFAAELAALNPQPLPPKTVSGDVAALKNPDWAALNPQPLPPKNLLE